MAGGPITDAFVSVSPDFSKFDRALEQGISRALADVENRFNRVFSSIEQTGANAAAAIERSFQKGTDGADRALDGLVSESDTAFDRIDAAAMAAGEQIEDAFREAAIQSDDALETIGGADVFAEIGAQAERAGEQVERSFDEAARQSNAALDRVNAGVGTLNTGLGGIGKLAATGLAVVGIQQVGQALKGAVEDAAEANRVSRVTESTIIATGGAAGVTADQIGEMSSALAMQTTVDDGLIASGANLLLTFKNVKDAGEGVDDIFGRATQAGLDLAATGFGSVEGNAVLLGKALNDPIKGLAALGKNGVTFTEDQKKMIAGFVEQNDLLSAQKVILGEVEAQVGGAAVAAADPMARLAFVAGELKETLGKGLLEAASMLAPVFQTLLVAAEPLIKVIGQTLGELLTALGPALAVIAESLGESLVQLAPLLVPIAEAFGDLLIAVAPLLPILVELLVAVLEPLLPVLPILVKGIAIFAGVLAEVLKIAGPILPVLAAMAAAAFLLTNPITALVLGVTLLAGAFDKIWPILQRVGAAVGRFVAQLPGMIVGAFSALGGMLVEAITAAWDFLLDAIPGLFGQLLDLWLFLPTQIIDAIVTFGPMLLGWITDAFLAVVTALPGLIMQIVDLVAAVPLTIITSLAGFGAMLATTFATAFTDGLTAVTKGIADIVSGITGFIGDVPGLAGDMLTAMLGFGKSILQGLKDGVEAVGGIAADIAGAIKKAVGGVINRILGLIESPINTALDIMDKAAGPFVNFPDVKFPRVALADGAIVTRATQALIGEAGPEVVIPLTRPDRALELMANSGLLGMIGAAMAGAGSSATMGADGAGGLTVNVDVEIDGAATPEHAAALTAAATGAAMTAAEVAAKTQFYRNIIRAKGQR